MAPPGFSRGYGYLLCPPGRSLAVLSGLARATPFNALFRQRAAVSLPGHLRSCATGSGLLTACASDSPRRVLLSSRLTPGRLASPGKPWVFGVNIPIFIVVTHAYIFFSGRSSKPRGSPSAPTGMLPYHAATKAASSASATVLMPDHHPRGSARPVSCYALFE